MRAGTGLLAGHPVLVLGTALGFMALEVALGRLARHDTHDLAEDAATLGVVLVQPLFRAAEAGLAALPFAAVYAHRLATIDARSPLGFAALFLAADLLYYWEHRAAHRVGWLWANHSVHHSATRLNLAAGLRLGWTGALSGGFLFFLPLALLGFHPYAIVSVLGLSLVWQFFLHTELAPRLGPLEWLLNTPHHHRIHHAANPSCRDRNFGGMLIVWDRLFGTFAEAPAEPLRYGLAGEAPRRDPVSVALGGWWRLARALRHAGGARRALGLILGPPRGDPLTGESDR